MADIKTAIAGLTKRASPCLIRQDTFFDVTMSKKRLDRIVPIMAVHETVPPAQDTHGEHIQQVLRDAPGQACEAVLATPELLGNILVFLPAKNIFGITRVSRAFRNCVATSSAIQEKLCFRPSGPPKEVWQVMGPQLSWSRAIRKRFYLKLTYQSELDPETDCLVTPVVPNPCVSIVGTSSNYCVTINVPKVHLSSGRSTRPRVADLLKVSGAGSGISLMDTYILKPICEKIDVRLRICLVDYTGTSQVEFSIRQTLSGQDTPTLRSALRACWKSSHMRRLWRRGKWKDGTEFTCHWVENVKISELVKRLEEEEGLTAVIGDSTKFVLCGAMVASEATRAAVELETE